MSNRFMNMYIASAEFKTLYRDEHHRAMDVIRKADEENNAYERSIVSRFYRLAMPMDSRDRERLKELQTTADAYYTGNEDLPVWSDVYPDEAKELERLEEMSRRPPMLFPIEEQLVSSAFDMSDCHDGPVDDIYYLDDDGKLYPVTAGKGMQRINEDEECPFHYAQSDLVANGKAVGTIIHTDH